MNDLMERLDRSIGDGPPLGPVDDLVRRGRRAQRRRTVVTAASGVAAVTAVATGGVALAGSVEDGEPRQETPAQPADRGTLTTPSPDTGETLPKQTLPQTPAEFDAMCSDATESSPRFDRLIFGKGEPQLMARASGSLEAYALYRSADGSHWGKCQASKVGGGVWSTMSVYGETADDSREPGTTTSDCSTCPVQDSFVAVLPPSVATVRISYIDGATESASTNDGFVALTHTLQDVPKANREMLSVIRRIQYLGADGGVLAEFAAPGVSPTPGVATLDAYPARDDSQPLGYDQGSGNYR